MNNARIINYGLFWSHDIFHRSWFYLLLISAAAGVVCLSLFYNMRQEVKDESIVVDTMKHEDEIRVELRVF